MARRGHWIGFCGALLWFALVPSVFGAAGEYMPGGGLRVSTEFLPVVQSTGRFLDVQGSSVRGLRADGSLDSTFSNDGMVELPAPVAAGRVVLLSGDRFAVGSADAVRRFLPDGSPDLTFGTDGATTVGGAVKFVLVESNGRLLVVSEVDGAVVVSAIQSDGSLDASFGTAGRRTLAEIRTASAAAFNATGLAIAGRVSEGSLPSTFTSVNPTYYSRLVVVANDGTTAALSAPLDVIARRIRTTADNDLLLVGTAYSRNEKGSVGKDAAVLRIAPTGNVRGAGRIGFDEDWLSLGSDARGLDVVELADGRILLLGTNVLGARFPFDGHRLFFSARFTATMKLDVLYGPHAGLTYHPEMQSAGYDTIDGELRGVGSGGGVDITMYPCRVARQYGCGRHLSAYRRGLPILGLSAYASRRYRPHD